MMKFVVIVALFGCAFAQQTGRQSNFRPAQAPRPAPGSVRYEDITNLRSEFDNPGDGNYFYAYENSDGTAVQQKGTLKAPPPGEEFPILNVEGFYSHYTPEGEQVKVDYTANENGYQPRSDSIPTPPPIPEAIQKALEIIYRNADAQQKSSANKPQGNRRF